MYARCWKLLDHKYCPFAWCLPSVEWSTNGYLALVQNRYANITTDIADAVAHLYGKKIIHGDIQVNKEWKAFMGNAGMCYDKGRGRLIAFWLSCLVDSHNISGILCPRRWLEVNHLEINIAHSKNSSRPPSLMVEATLQTRNLNA
ncbi:hypothetical protein K439DRAFT_1657683 [Ramaria rubella]|nr:hypothetical protein K439DRAFT_1657683 [Ramaria rubella]